MLCAVSLLAVPAALAGPDKESTLRSKADERKGGDHNLSHPLREKQDKLREKALERRLRGDDRARGKVAKVGKNYVELAREDSDRIFVVIADFGNARHPSFCDAGEACAFPPDGSAATYDGPARNSIPQPNRRIDNTTLWQADYNRAHYQDMYFNRMASYYQAQSSGRYSVEGDVTEWVRVPFNEARYGRDYCGGIVCTNTWFLIRDALAFWVQGQLDSGKTMVQVQAYLKTFDEWDRYDFDGDGTFAEADGYIDHFQIVHAGGDQAAADPNQGSDAIWSHRWYANLHSVGGPAGGAPFGGTEVGEGGASGGLTIPSNPTGVWVGDYTIQPENGGLGVFAHEFGHDLGLPDLYDTSGNTGGAENSTGFWTLMSSGANIGDGGRDGIGDDPTDLGAWEKFQLGWLGCTACAGGRFYDVSLAGSSSDHTLGPAEHATEGQAQALFVVLPPKAKTLQLTTPPGGSYAFWSTRGDDLNTTMTKAAGGSALTATVWYEIEDGWDYAFLEASTDGGTTWVPVQTNRSYTGADQSGFNTVAGHLVGGISGASHGNVSLTATLPAGTDTVRFRYQTDSAYVLNGFVVDDVAIDGTTIGNAESDAEGWVRNGFVRTTGTESSTHFNAYVAEFRGYRDYDRSLQTAYNFGFLDKRPDWVESFPYQDGLLVSYWDETFEDNNVGDHPGGGLVLPVDAHPTFHHTGDGHLMRPRILTFDSTFGLDDVDEITLHKDSAKTKIKRQKAQPVFNDKLDWWFDTDGDGATGSHVGRYQPGWVGVNVPKTGTQISVVEAGRRGAFLKVQVRPAP
jgi:immune inhibitor A